MTRNEFIQQIIIGNQANPNADDMSPGDLLSHANGLADHLEEKRGLMFFRPTVADVNTYTEEGT